MQSQTPDLEQQTRSIQPQGLATLLKVSNALSASLELNDVLQTAIMSVTDTIGVETGAIYTLEGDELYLGATTPPLPPAFPNSLRLANINNHPHIKKAIETKTPVYIEDTSKSMLSVEERDVVDARHLVSILYFPLFLKREAIGVFIVGTTKKSINLQNKRSIFVISSLHNHLLQLQMRACTRHRKKPQKRSSRPMMLLLKVGLVCLICEII